MFPNNIFLRIISQDISSNPCMFVDGVSRFDVVQGSVGELKIFSEKLSFFTHWIMKIDINPSFFIGNSNSYSISIGNCWMVAALANLTLNDELFNRVVPQDQGFTSGYTGQFSFCETHILICTKGKTRTSERRILSITNESSFNDFWQRSE